MNKIMRNFNGLVGGIALAFISSIALAADNSQVAPVVAPSAEASAVSTNPTTTVSAPAQAVAPEEARRASYKVMGLYSNYSMNQAGLKKTSGALAGFNLGGEYKLKADPQIIAWGIEYFNGTPDYNGQNSLASGTVSKKTDMTFYTFGAAWGARRQVGDSASTIDSTVGLSYRYLDNKVRDRKVVQNEQALLFVPVVFGTDRKLSDKWVARASAEGDFVIVGQNRQHFSDLDGGLPKGQVSQNDLPVAKLTQNSGLGAKLALGARRTMSDLNLSAEVYYRYWQLPDSTSQNFTNLKGSPQVAFEPASSTEMFGLGLGVAF